MENHHPYAQAQEVDQLVGVREISLEWEAIEQASKYEIKISAVTVNSKEKSHQNFMVESPLWSGKLMPGHYTMELRSFDSRGVPGEWSEPKEFSVKFPNPRLLAPAQKARIDTQVDGVYQVEFRWEEIPGAPEYSISLESSDGTVKRSERTKDNHLDINLPVAQVYKWSVKVETEDISMLDEASMTNSFLLFGKGLPAPKIDRPTSPYIRQLSWEKPQFSENFDLVLLRKKGKAWKSIQKLRGHPENEISFDPSRPSGIYKLRLRARAALRPASPTSELSFEFRGGSPDERDQKEQQLAESLEKPTDLYFIASYLLTQVSYRGENHELNSNSAFNAIGGTGRLGLGYLPRSQKWGLFSIVDLSGFDLDGQRFTFASAEIHGNWKQYWGKNQLLLGGGVFLKELPDLQGGQASGFSGLGKVKSYGPHIGAQLWRPISNKLGFQIQGRAYYTLMGTASANQKVNPSLSYQMGLLGTYKLNSRTMGYAGYVYRLDKSIYESAPFSSSNPNSFAAPGDTNTIQLTGHYLNLVLEYSF
ncbi:MAG: hypothetical protein KDD35_00735 [Bdellovibrionales bacterium]|nr:hypothetical protein [Bdellovibrionales bacterium]